MFQQKAIAIGCIFVGLVLIVSALRSLKTGVTLSGRGGPSGPIRRQERPGSFWYYFFARIILGPIAVVGGLFYWFRWLA